MTYPEDIDDALVLAACGLSGTLAGARQGLRTRRNVTDAQLEILEALLPGWDFHDGDSLVAIIETACALA